jgi:hypothetical protein
MEKWREATLAIGHEISSLGNVRKMGSTTLKKTHLSGDGYVKMSNPSPTSSTPLAVHRVVATAFLPNPNNLPVVNHKDFNKQNNAVDNLEWVTQQENAQHSGTAQRKVFLVMDGNKLVGR